MPGRDRRGPEGEGPMTGRGLGNCSGNDKVLTEEEQLRGRGQRRGLFGRGLGRGFGGGRGRGFGRRRSANN